MDLGAHRVGSGSSPSRVLTTRKSKTAAESSVSTVVRIFTGGGSGGTGSPEQELEEQEGAEEETETEEAESSRSSWLLFVVEALAALLPLKQSDHRKGEDVVESFTAITAKDANSGKMYLAEGPLLL